MDLRETVDHVRRHPGMWFGHSEPTYAECSAFLLGWDQATGHQALAGFKEWLVARVGQDSSNLAWPGLVSLAVRHESRGHDLSPEEEARLVEGLWALVDEFLTRRAGTR